MSKTILVIEDTDMLRRMYADRLEHDGYRVLLASDGADALALLRTDSPDLILLDLIMPRMSGLEVLDLVKRDPRLKDIPVLILSNLGQEDDIKRGIEMGAVDYLIKNDARPVDVSARIAELLAEEVQPNPPTESVTPPQLQGFDVRRGQEAYKLHIRDHEADAERLVHDTRLVRRFWCPACEVELVVELLPKPEEHGWYDAHLTCPQCCREF